MTVAGQTAVISPCGQYRYLLTRRWGQADRLTFVMLNPSTADASMDDATIRRCVGFARREGCGGLAVLNLFAWRATQPSELAAVDDPVGPENDATFDHTLRRGDRVVCAWGNHGRLLERDLAVGHLLRNAGVQTVALGVTANGCPRHPLYLPIDAPLRPFHAATRRG